MPSAQIAAMPIAEQTWDAYKAEISELYERLKAENPDSDVRIDASLHGYVTRVADYTNVYSGRGYYASAFTGDTYLQQLASGSSSRYDVFKGNSTAPMEMEDVFRDGADIPALLKKAAKAELANAGEEYVTISADWFDDLLDNLYKRHLNFALGSDEITIYPENMDYSSVYSLVQAYGGEYLESAWVYTSAAQTLRYDLIGIDNLKLFN